MGRRFEKNVDGVVTRYLYSNEGLIGEYDANNNLKKSYGWMPNGIWGTDPLYMTENNQTYYYHNDALGTPQKMTDASGTVVWSAAYTSFGEATIDPSSTITSNLRFAGQCFDQETGNHYNLFRVYDPKTGTFISKDPIGFDGGDVNLYRYISNNSINLIDPLGLSSLLYDSDTQTISVNIGDKLIDKFPAGNNTTSDSKGPWAKGVYPYSHYVSHPESGSTGPYGSHGNFVFDVPGRTGMGVHSGRRSPRDRTEGCIRTTDEGTLSILIMHLVDPITHITVCGGNAPCSSGSSIFNILGKTGKAYKFK